MKIATANLSMQSQHLATLHQETRESLRSWVGARPNFEGNRQGPTASQVQISDTAKAAQSSEAQAIQDATDAVENDPMLRMIRRMVELLTGRPVRVFNAREMQGGQQVADVPSPRSAGQASGRQPVQSNPSGQNNSSAGFGIEYDYHSVREETEATSFSAQGIVQTADGHQIEFQLNLAMARSFREETNVSVRVGDAQRKDPLVINFDGNAAQLTDQRFRFDLDADGDKEELAMLAAGSGYLALDKNGNGTIDSGSELFGPASGSGFAELANHDQDSNGWIDENDAVYSKLRVWAPDVKSAGALTTLMQAQVGALFLGDQATPFELRNGQNRDLGAVRSTGIYLTESGHAGTLQEIDLTV